MAQNAGGEGVVNVSICHRLAVGLQVAIMYVAAAGAAAAAIAAAPTARPVAIMIVRDDKAIIL